MADDVKKLMLQIDASVELLRRNLAQGEQRLAEFERTVNTRTKAVDSAFARMGTGLTGVAKSLNVAKVAATAFMGSIVISRLQQAVSTGLEYAASLQEMAQQAGVTTDTLQEFRYIATQVGLTTEEMDASLAMFTKRLGQAASGNKEMIATFNKLSGGFRDAKGEVRETGDAIERAADAVNGMKSQAEQSALAVEFFGKSGMRMASALAMGSKAIRQMREDAHRFGLVLTEAAIEKADKAADTISRLNRVMQVSIAGAVAENSGAILELANSLAVLVRGLAVAGRAWNHFRNSMGGGNITDSFSRRVIEARLTPGTGLGGFAGLTNATKIPTTSDGEAVAIPGGGGGKGRGGKGEDPRKAAHDYDEQVRSLMERYTQARLGMAVTAEDEYELNIRMVELARIRAEADLAMQDKLTEAQRARLAELQAEFVDLERERIDREHKQRLTDEQREARQANFELEKEALEAQANLARTAGERRDIEMRILKLQQAEETARLEAVIAAGKIADATKARADLESKQAADIENARRGTAGPLEEYARRRTPEELQERAEELIVDELNHVQRGISDAITKAIGIDDPLISGLLDMLLQEILFRPLAEALSGAGGLFGGGGGGGLLGGIFSLFGGLFAEGGTPPMGKVSVVGEKGPELFVPKIPGRILSNADSQRALSGGGGAGVAITINAPGATAETVSMIRRELRVWAPAIVEASQRSTIRKINRPKLP